MLPERQRHRDDRDLEVADDDPLERRPGRPESHGRRRDLHLPKVFVALNWAGDESREVERIVQVREEPDLLFEHVLVRVDDDVQDAKEYVGYPYKEVGKWQEHRARDEVVTLQPQEAYDDDDKSQGKQDAAPALSRQQIENVPEPQEGRQRSEGRRIRRETGQEEEVDQQQDGLPPWQRRREIIKEGRHRGESQKLRRGYVHGLDSDRAADAVEQSAKGPFGSSA